MEGYLKLIDSFDDEVENTNLEIKIEKEREYSKDIWMMICQFLSLREISRLSQLNKRFNKMINKSSQIWNNILKNLNNENPFHLYHKIFYLEDHWKEKRDCFEKKQVFEEIMSRNRIIWTTRKEVNFKNCLGRFNYTRYLFFSFIPLMFIIFLVLLGLKISNVMKVNTTVCFIPLFLYFSLFFIEISIQIGSNGKRWRHKLGCGFKSSFSEHLSIYFISLCAIILTLLIALKSGSIISLNINVLFFFIYSFILVSTIITSYLGNAKFFTIFCSVNGVLIFIFTLLIHLSMIGEIKSEKKWFVSFIPIWITLSILSIACCTYIFLAAITSRGRFSRKNKIISVAIIVCTFVLIIGTIILPFCISGKVNIFASFSFYFIFLIFIQIFSIDLLREYNPN